MLVEEPRILEVDRVTGLGHHHQPRRWHGALEEGAGTQRRAVFISVDDQRRHYHLLEVRLKLERRRPAHLHPTQRHRSALLGMLAELVDKFFEAARVLRLQLFAPRPRPVDRREFLCAFVFPALRHHLNLCAKLRRLLWLGTETNATNDNRKGSIRVDDAEVHRGKATHRQADDVRFGDFQVVKNVLGVIDGAALAVFFQVVRYLRWRITARAERDAAIAPAEVANLRFPGAMVAGKLVDEDDGDTAPRFLEVQLYAIGCSHVRHGVSLFKFVRLKPVYRAP